MDIANIIVLSRYRPKLGYKISATRFYSSGAYLYIGKRLSEIKCLLFRAPLFHCKSWGQILLRPHKKEMKNVFYSNSI